MIIKSLLFQIITCQVIELYRDQIYQEILNDGEVIKFSNASFCEIRKNINQINQEIIYQLSNQDRKDQQLKSSAINSQDKEIYILKKNVLQRLNESQELIHQIDINSQDVNQIIYFNNSLLVVGLKFLLIYDSQLINYKKLQYPSDLKSVISNQEQVALITVNNDLVILRGQEFQILSSIYAYDLFQGQNYILQKQGAQFHLFIWNQTDGQKQLIQNLFLDYEPQQLLVYNDLQFLIITTKTLIIFNQSEEIQIQNRQYQAFKFKNSVIIYSHVGALNVENFICLPQQVIQLYQYDDQLFALNMDYLFKFSINEQIRRLQCNPTHQNFGLYQLSLTGGQERVIQIELKRPVLTSSYDSFIILFAVLFLGTIFFFGIFFSNIKKNLKSPQNYQNDRSLLYKIGVYQRKVASQAWSMIIFLVFLKKKNTINIFTQIKKVIKVLSPYCRKGDFMKTLPQNRECLTKVLVFVQKFNNLNCLLNLDLSFPSRCISHFFFDLSQLLNVVLNVSSQMTYVTDQFKVIVKPSENYILFRQFSNRFW